MTLDEKLGLVAGSVGIIVKDNRLVKKNGKVYVPVIFNDLPFKMYERGDENKNLDVNFFNPVTEMTLRGDSPALNLIKNQISTLISRNVMITILTALQIVNKDDASIKLSAMFPKVKITTRHATAFKKYIEYLSENGIQAFTLNVKNNPSITVKGKQQKFLTGASITSNALTTLKKMTLEELETLGFKEGFADVFIHALNKVMKEGFLATSNNKSYSTFDSVAKGYNVFVKRSNSLVKLFKESKPATHNALWLEQSLIADDFKDNMLDLKRIPLFKDTRFGTLEEEEEEELVETDSVDEFDFDVTPDISTKPLPTVDRTAAIQPASQQQPTITRPAGIQPASQQAAIATQATPAATTDVSFEPFEYSAVQPALAPQPATTMTLNNGVQQNTMLLNNGMQQQNTMMLNNGMQQNGMVLNNGMQQQNGMMLNNGMQQQATLSINPAQQQQTTMTIQPQVQQATIVDPMAPDRGFFNPN
jgi:hypothetical protein